MKERLDVVRLEAARFGTLHVFADALDTARVHGVVRQRTLVQQVLEMAAVEGLIQNGGEVGFDLRALTVADRLDEEITQRFAFELELDQHVEHLAAEGLPRLFELLRSFR